MSIKVGNYAYDTQTIGIDDFLVDLMQETNIATGNVSFRAMIVQYVGNKTDVIVPDVFNDHYITTHIQTNAFFQNKIIESVRLPNTITHISENAFCGCENLKKVQMYTSLEFTCGKNEIWISDCVFAYCFNLEEVSFLEKEVLTYAASRCQFTKCHNLKKLTAKLKYVRAETLENCNNLEEITIANDGFLEPKAVDCVPSLKRVVFCGNVDMKNMSKRTFAKIAKLEIVCKAESNVAELAYTGSNILFL